MSRGGGGGGGGGGAKRYIIRDYTICVLNIYYQATIPITDKPIFKYIVF